MRKPAYILIISYLFLCIFNSFPRQLTVVTYADALDGNENSLVVDAIEVTAQEKGYEGNVQMVEQAKKLISSIGIALPAKELDAFVTRGEFIVAFANILKLTPSERTDTVPDDALNTAIEFCRQRGFISNNNDFEPQRNITFAEALKISVIAVGFELEAQGLGGYPYGYAAAAKSIKLDDGIDLQMDKELNHGDLSILLRNVLETDIRTQSAYGYNNQYTITKGINILTKYYQLVSVQGIIDADENTSLYDEQVTCRNGHIQISGTSFKYNGEYMLGERVKGYAKDKDGDYELIYLEGHKTNTIRVGSKAIFEVQSTMLSYKDENDKTQKINIADPVAFVYNGKAYNTYQSSDFMFELGYITFIDNNNDDVYDVAIVNESTITYVSKTETFSKYIHGVNKDEFIALDNNNIKYSIFENGAKIDFKDIPVNSIINVYASKDGELLRLIVTTQYIEGIVAEISESDAMLKIDDAYYKYSTYFKNNYLDGLSIGDTASLLIDELGFVTAIFDMKNVMAYGYVIKAKAKATLGDGFQLKIFNEKGKMLIFDTASRVVIDGESFSASKKKEKLSLVFIDSATDNVKEQLIQYSINQQGEINMIDTVSLETGTVNEYDDPYDRLKLYEFAASSSLTANIPFRGTVFLPYFSLGKGAPVFRVKTDTSLTDEERCTIEGTTFLTSITHTGSSLKPYNVSEAGVAEAVLIYDSSVLTLADNATTGLVSRINWVMNLDGEKVIKMELYTPDKEFKTYVIRKMDVLKELNSLYLTETEKNNGILPIVPGDYIRFALNSDDEIAIINKDFDYKTGVIKKVGTSVAANLYYSFGKVYSVDNNVLMLVSKSSLSNQPNMEDPSLRLCLSADDSVVIFEAYDNRTYTVPGSLRDIVAYLQDTGRCSTILARMVNGVCKNIIIYK